MISVEGFCRHLSLPLAPSPHYFRLEGAGDLMLREEDGQLVAALLAAQDGQMAATKLMAALALASKKQEGPDLFLSQLATGHLCFHILSPGAGDETLPVAARIDEVAAFLRNY